MNNGRDCKHGQLARSCEICGLEAEVERLTECLKNANNNHEEFERKWYLAIDEQDELKDENAQLKAELAEAKSAFDRLTPHAEAIIAERYSLVLGLEAASCYIDVLGGDSKSYRIAIAAPGANRVQG